MKIAIAQLNVLIGDFTGNCDKMLAKIEQAKAEKADIICFSELAVCGYPPRDFLEFDDFIHLSNECLNQLAAVSNDIAIIVGAPSKNPQIEGKDLFNSAFFISEGKIQHQINKALLPTYDVFDEYRYFEPETDFKVVPFKGKKIAITICEDIWNIGNENPLYQICPMDELIKQDPDFMINISASPFNYHHAEERIHVCTANVEKYKIPLFYVNHVGAQTELIFDGGSVIMSPDGNLFEEFPYFKEAFKVI